MLIVKEGIVMKCLEINKGKGYYLNSKGDMNEIDKITKEDILRLLDIATDKEQNFEMDLFENNNLQNKSHEIIYASLYKKFHEVLQNKDRFFDESTAEYKDALSKYNDDM